MDVCLRLDVGTDFLLLLQRVFEFWKVRITVKTDGDREQSEPPQTDSTCRTPQECVWGLTIWPNITFKLINLTTWQFMTQSALLRVLHIWMQDSSLHFIRRIQSRVYRLINWACRRTPPETKWNKLHVAKVEAMEPRCILRRREEGLRGRASCRRPVKHHLRFVFLLWWVGIRLMIGWMLHTVRFGGCMAR